MTEITLKLTFEELKQIDKYVELNDETRPLFDKIQNAYPEPETLLDVIRNLGYSYDCCYEIVDAVEEFQKPKEPEKEQQIKELVKESVKWCEEHPNESVEDYLKPQTPEQIEKSLKEAFKEVQQTEDWEETQRKIDAPAEERSDFDKMLDDLVEKFKKDPPDFLKFELSRSLEDRIYMWWNSCFVHHPEWSMEECVEDLLDIITLFLPGEQDSSGTQRIETEIAVEAHNELLQKIKSKLRNKKDT